MTASNNSEVLDVIYDHLVVAAARQGISVDEAILEMQIKLQMRRDELVAEIEGVRMMLEIAQRMENAIKDCAPTDP